MQLLAFDEELGVSYSKYQIEGDSHSLKRWSTLYDILVILISIADVVTDFVMLTMFYNTGRMIFFWISFSILITTQIGYIFIFWLTPSHFLHEVFRNVPDDDHVSCHLQMLKP